VNPADEIKASRLSDRFHTRFTKITKAAKPLFIAPEPRGSRDSRLDFIDSLSIYRCLMPDGEVKFYGLTGNALIPAAAVDQVSNQRIHQP
jgi:hypothetical protein